MSKKSTIQIPYFDYFKCIENIDYSIFALSMIEKEEAKKMLRSPIQIMVDDSTGYSVSKNIESIKNTLYHLNRIHRYKSKLNKQYGCNHSLDNTKKSIKALKEVLKSITNPQTPNESGRN